MSGTRGYDALSAAEREELVGLNVIHDYKRSWAALGAQFPDVFQRTPTVHPLLRRHPDTGRTGLYLSAHAWSIEGMSDDESRPLLEFLGRHMTRTEFTFRHRWRERDLVFWDNRFTLHYPIDDFTGYRRLLHRCTALES